MTGIQITPAYVGLAARGFAQGQVDVEDAWMRLQSSLTANAGMAGNDTFAHDFDARYSRGLEAAWNAFRSSIVTLGGISLGLTTTANNYIKADHHSTTGKGTPPPAYLTPERVAQSFTMALPPSSIGPGHPGLPGFLARCWPNGHQDRLRSAAAAWTAAAREVDGVGARLTTTIHDITDTGRPDAHAITDLWARVYGPCNTTTVLGGLPELCRAMANACQDYATAIDHAHSSAERRLAAAGIVVGLTTAVAIGLTLFTGGASDVAGGGLDAAEAAAILGPVEAEATAAVTEATAAIADTVAEVETAAVQAPAVEAVEAETTQLETALDEELTAAESGGSNPAFSSETLGRAFESANTESKLAHVIDPAMHGFSDLVAHAGGRSEAMRWIVNSLAEGSDLPIAGRFEVIRVIDGESVTIRGAVVNGMPRIGTAFIAAKFAP